MSTSSSDRPPRHPSLDTLAIHAGYEPDPGHGAVMPPIVLSTTFAQAAPGSHKGFDYGRSGNPTRATLETCLAALEGGTHAFAFASGCAAATCVLETLRPGDRVLCSDDVYGGTHRLLEKVARPRGIESRYVDMTDADAVRSALGEASSRPKLVWVETPSNPLLKIVDLRSLAAAAAEAGAMLVVDNTFATPVLQRPLELGADVVLHSMTKYLNGHSDVVGGALITRDASLAERLKFLQNATGAVPSPFDCYMVLRGLKTLGVRMERHVASAGLLAARLAGRPDVVRVRYPGLPDDPGHALAARQMTGAGGMISFEIAGPEALRKATAFLSALRIFTCAESLGGVESLAEHPAIMTHASIPPDLRANRGIGDGLIRLSVGLEGVEDLWDDLERGFAAALDA